MESISDLSVDVGPDLVARLEATVNDRVHRAIALRIRTKVLDARNDPDTSARRWPFELIQNAHDAGTRAGRDDISLIFQLDNGVLHFEHDAAPFTIDDFAALLTGGSSKDFMSTETTGRFGTGFLVTHVLSESVRVAGILQVDQAFRGFDVTLHRPNDEELLLQNVVDSQSSLLRTRSIENLATEASASLEYVVDDERLALAGLDALEQSLPHLFATCRRLGRITIRRGDEESVWSAHTRSSDTERDGILLSELEVTRVDNGRANSAWRVVRAAAGPGARGQLVVALDREGDGWTVYKPGGLPSVYRQLPLLGGPVLPGWVVIDGDFEVEQERKSIHVAGDAERPLRDAFSALGGLMQVASRENWRNGFRIAQLALPHEVSGETAIKVWTDVLFAAADALSRLPLVHTPRGDKLPCAEDTEHEKYADFIRRRPNGPTHDQLWTLAAATTNSDPPLQSISEGWSEVAEGWESLGVSVSWIDLEVIGKRAADEAHDISELNVDIEAYAWLAGYIDAVGSAWKAGGTTKSHVLHLLPDQNGRLCDANQLRRDAGVSQQVKQIAAEIGLDLKSELLDLRLVERLNDAGLAAGLYAVGEATSGELKEAEAVAAIVERLASVLPDEQKLTEDGQKAAPASISLLVHLWKTQGMAAEHVAFGMPLLAADGTARTPGRRRVMAPPVAAWPEPARRFSDAYPQARVLSDRYTAAGEPILEALAAWNIVHPALLISTSREEVTERGLRPIAAVPDHAAAATLRDAKMTQIALLEPELINYCKQSRERARALLGLIVCFVASADVSWRTTVSMMVRTPDGEKEILLTPTLWLSDVRSKPWIPVEEDGEDVHHPATPTLVRELLDPQWLESNPSGADLLVQHFGIDALDVRLLAAAGSEEERQRLRDSLAKIIEAAGGSSQVMEEIAVQVLQRQRDVNRMRRLGLAVQECVKAAMQRRGLTVGDVDHGYDYLVSAVEVMENGPDDLSSRFQLGKYKVEIKTTTTGEARLTPLQAATSVAEPDVFVLCVVDLRGFPADVHDTDWTGEDVSSLCKLVPGRRLPVADTVFLVQSAEGGEVPIRNTTALRYAIGPALWETGMNFDDWVRSAFPTIAPASGLSAVAEA